MNHFKKKYLLDVTEEKISDLKNRLKMTCFPDESVPGKWNAGTELGWFKELIQYWIEEFDWKKQEKLLNSFESENVNLTLIKEGDHRLSRPQDIKLLIDIVETLCIEIEHPI